MACDQIELKYITDRITAASQEIFGDKLNKVILYGSYARGDSDNESDIDIMILVNLSKEETVEQVKNAEIFVSAIENHLKEN